MTFLIDTLSAAHSIEDDDATRSMVIEKLEEIASRTAKALAERGFHSPVFFLPGYPPSVLSFGTTDDIVSEGEWGDIVMTIRDIVQDVLGARELSIRPLPGAQANPSAAFQGQNGA